MEAELRTAKEAKRKAEESLANKEIELASAKQIVEQESESAKEKLKADEEKIIKL